MIDTLSLAELVMYTNRPSGVTLTAHPGAARPIGAPAGRAVNASITTTALPSALVTYTFLPSALAATPCALATFTVGTSGLAGGSTVAPDKFTIASPSAVATVTKLPLRLTT